MGFASCGGCQRRRNVLEVVLLCALMLLQNFTAFLPDVYAEDGKQGNECNYEKDVHGCNSSDTIPYYHSCIINDLRTA